MNEKRIGQFVFQINDCIGQGSYGQVQIYKNNSQVFKGIDDHTKQIVAIKMIAKKLINSDDYLLEGLMSEIKIMQKLKSPYIVQLVDVLETSNNYYIVQEFCDSGDLSGQLKKYMKMNRLMQEQEVHKLMIDLLRGFMELIKNGIIHRDLKPANILIHQGAYKLADFGLSKCVDNFKNEMLQSSVGTPLYMSPQILVNDKYTSKCDIWSLGFILYEALYNQTPWTGKSIPELHKTILNQRLQFLDNKNRVSDLMKELLRGCLQVDEAARLTWDDLYRHPLFVGQFDDYFKKHKQLEEKANFLITNIRQKVLWDKIDLMELFDELDMSKDKTLSINEFVELLKRIDNTLSRDEMEYIFNKIDEDSSNSIEFHEFQKWLQENNVRMSTRPQPFQNNFSPNQYQAQPSVQSFQQIPDQSQAPKYLPYNQPQQYQNQRANSMFGMPNNAQLPYQQYPLNQSYQNSNQQIYGMQPLPMNISGNPDKASVILCKLKLAITKYNINIHDLFLKYDKSQNYSLEVDEFSLMLRYFQILKTNNENRKIDPKLEDSDIQQAFNLFDKNKDGSITYKEFQEQLNESSQVILLSLFPSFQSQSHGNIQPQQQINYQGYQTPQNYGGQQNYPTWNQLQILF